MTQETMTLQKLDEALALLPASPVTQEDLEARATLMARRIELANAARAESANSRPQPRGGLVVYVPEGIGTSHYYGRNGRVCQSRMTTDGRLVLDLFPQEFRELLMERQNGQAWLSANPAALEFLGRI